MMDVALFDFCDTLVNFQTADPYVYYAANMLNRKLWFNNIMDRSYLVKNFFMSHLAIRKKLVLFQLLGLQKADLEVAGKRYYKERIVPNLNSEIINCLQEYKKKGYKILIVSAGYNVYLDFFAADYGIDGVIANEFKYCGNRFCGIIKGEDCIGESKVCRIESFFDRANIGKSVSVSDSYSDLPMLDWADKAIVVSREKKQDWADMHSFDQIVL